MRQTVTLLLIGALTCQVCLAQVETWERVRLIEPGQRVQVKLSSGKTVNGAMEAWSVDGLAVLRGKDKVMQLARSDVASVSRIKGMDREGRGSWAFLITFGAVVGSAGVYSLATRGKSEPYIVMALGVLLGLAAGGVAALIGAVSPQQKEVIYTAAPSMP